MTEIAWNDEQSILSAEIWRQDLSKTTFLSQSEWAYDDRDNFYRIVIAEHVLKHGQVKFKTVFLLVILLWKFRE